MVGCRLRREKHSTGWPQEGANFGSFAVRKLDFEMREIGEGCCGQRNAEQGAHWHILLKLPDFGARTEGNFGANVPKIFATGFPKFPPSLPFW